MLLFALKRLASAVPTLLILITLAFFMMRLAPGGPFDAERQLPAEIEASLAARYQLDAPLWQQYLSYLGNALQGDLGPSFQYQDFAVHELIAAGAPVSFRIGLAAILLALLVGVSLGAAAAIRQNRPADHLLMGTAMTGIVMPSFVIAPLCILLFSVQLGWLPAGGYGNGQWTHLLLPVLALALPQIAWIARLTRGSLLDVLASPFMLTARAKGLSTARLLLVHASKPTLLPVLSYLGPAVAGIITGSIVIETIFGLPGIGRYFVQGALNRDYTLVLGVTLFYGLLIIALNFLVDLLYSWLDPAVRAE